MEFLVVCLLFITFTCFLKYREARDEVKDYEYRFKRRSHEYDTECPDCKANETALRDALEAYHSTSSVYRKAALYIDALERQYQAVLRENTILRSGKGGVQRQLSKNVIKDLLVLCHPDKHDNTELSGKMTRWLIQQRKK